MSSKDLTNKLSYRFLRYLFNENDFQNEYDLRKIKLDSTSIYSITPYKYTIQINELIKKHTGSFNMTITDATACVGGDSISFCKHFKKVNSIELCPDRFYFLCENLKLYGFNNCMLYNGNSLEIIKKIKQDIIFLDMPWGGRNYKDKKEMELYLSGIPSYKICNDFKKYAEYVVLKVPNNFGFERFKKNINFSNCFVYDLEKFQLLIVY